MFGPSNVVREPKTQSYIEWFRSVIAEGHHAGSGLTHGDYIRTFYSELTDIIKKCGYSLEDEKGFKSSVATLLYDLSDEARDE